MATSRALRRWISVVVGVVGLAIPVTASANSDGGGSIPRLGRRVPAVGDDINDVITTTCGNSPVIVLAVIVCEWELPGREAQAEAMATGPRGVRRSMSRRLAPRATPPSSARLEQVKAIADSSGWDWRRAGVTIHAGFHPQACCHWGIYDSRDGSIWIGPSAFAHPARLRYTVLHELGHAWQWRSGRLDRVSADMAPWGRRGIAALEAGADCLSTVWGASPRSGYYWACPQAAAGLVVRRLADDWGS
jgi:hypothetical protein